MRERRHHVFRVVLYRHGAEWYGHCIDCDVVSSGATEQKAADAVAEALEVLIEESVRSGDLAQLYVPAPRELWEMYARSKKSNPVRRLNVDAEDNEAELHSVAVA